MQQQVELQFKYFPQILQIDACLVYQQVISFKLQLQDTLLVLVLVFHFLDVQVHSMLNKIVQDLEFARISHPLRSESKMFVPHGKHKMPFMLMILPL